MNLHDAAGIMYGFREQPIDPPTVCWTDDDERDYAAWLASERASLVTDFLARHDDLFDEFCRDKFEEECL